jgi:hypothetical protein
LIPPEGRDVQCSACGHTWFAGHATAGAEIAAPTPPAAPRPPAPPPTRPMTEDAAARPGPDGPDVAPAVAPADESGTASEIPDPDDGTADPAARISALVAAQDAAPPGIAQGQGHSAPQPSAPAPPRAAPPPPPADDDALMAVSNMVATSRATLSETAAAVLREEAAREEAARRAESARPVEVQTDLGLEAHMQPEQQRAEETRRRMARLKGEPAPPTTAPITAQPPARRDLFPDIEEINSTLRSTADRTAEAMVIYPEDVDQRRGRWVGFSTVLVIFGILAAIYAFAPAVIRTVPQSTAVVTRYVEIVDDGRLWLDLRLQGVLQRMQGETGTPTPAAEALPDALPQTLPEPAPAPGPAPDVGSAPDQAPPPAPDGAPATNP